MSIFGKVSAALDKRAMDNLNKASSAVAGAEDRASTLGQSKAVFGDMLNKTAGGAIIGGVGNAAIYSDQQRDLGGSYSMGEAFLSGAAAGAFGGAVIGALGAKATARGARGNLEKANKRLDKARERAERRGLLPYDRKRRRVGSDIDWRERIPNYSSSLDTRQRLSPKGTAKLNNQMNLTRFGKKPESTRLRTVQMTHPLKPVRALAIIPGQEVFTPTLEVPPGGFGAGIKKPFRISDRVRHIGDSTDLTINTTSSQKQNPNQIFGPIKNKKRGSNKRKK